MVLLIINAIIIFQNSVCYLTVKKTNYQYAFSCNNDCKTALQFLCISVENISYLIKYLIFAVCKNSNNRVIKKNILINDEILKKSKLIIQFRSNLYSYHITILIDISV